MVGLQWACGELILMVSWSYWIAKEESAGMVGIDIEGVGR